MEERFKAIGKEFAEELVSKHGIKLTDELIERCQNFRWNWFCADCSDDYSVTLKEQAALKESFNKYIEECIKNANDTNTSGN